MIHYIALCCSSTPAQNIFLSQNTCQCPTLSNSYNNISSQELNISSFSRSANWCPKEHFLEVPDPWRGGDCLWSSSRARQKWTGGLHFNRRFWPVHFYFRWLSMRSSFGREPVLTRRSSGRQLSRRRCSPTLMTTQSTSSALGQTQGMYIVQWWQDKLSSFITSPFYIATLAN